MAGEGCSRAIGRTVAALQWEDMSLERFGLALPRRSYRCDIVQLRQSLRAVWKYQTTAHVASGLRVVVRKRMA